MSELKLSDVLKAIADEEELPGDMPDKVWEELKDDRDAMSEALKMTVRLTKAGITERILKL